PVAPPSRCSQWGKLADLSSAASPCKIGGYQQYHASNSQLGMPATSSASAIVAKNVRPTRALMGVGEKKTLINTPTTASTTALVLLILDPGISGRAYSARFRPLANIHCCIA